ncbi:hypothetical protein K7432_013906 [Basidiobolus ranarum]|uniref:Uncharacterized protein n=1 Tax=Basidiobolus ranarum TaxID=34480 RepID=A0ABR2WIL9_9FUNG
MVFRLVSIPGILRSEIIQVSQTRYTWQILVHNGGNVSCESPYHGTYWSPAINWHIMLMHLEDTWWYVPWNLV